MGGKRRAAKLALGPSGIPPGDAGRLPIWQEGLDGRSTAGGDAPARFGDARVQSDASDWSTASPSAVAPGSSTGAK